MRNSDSTKIKTFWPLLGVLGLLVTLFAWGLSTPVGGTPDEDFHLVSTWCASGGTEGMCEPSDSAEQRLVRSSLVKVICFAQKPTVSAACQEKYSVFESTELIPTGRGNFQGAYPQLFYATMHLFAGDDVEASVITMRFVNALLFCLLMVSLWLLVPAYLRSSLYFTVALTVVPLGLFLIPSINPSSWAILGAVTTFFATAGALRSHGRRSYLLWALAIFGLVLGGGARYDSLIYALVAFVSAFILANTFTMTKKALLIGLGSLAVLSLIFVAFGGLDIILRLAGQAGSSNQNAEVGALGVLFINVAQLPMLFAGFSGAMGIGWLDTSMPFTTWMVAAALVWAALFARLADMKKRSLWLSGSLMVLLIIIPLLVLQAGMATVGENVQSRYIYPLFLVLVATVFYRGGPGVQFFTTPQTAIITVGLFASQALALYTNMSRYISAGASQSGWNLNAAAESGWWWPAGPSPMLSFVVGTIGFGVFLLTGFLFARRGIEHDTTVAPATVEEAKSQSKTLR